MPEKLNNAGEMQQYDAETGRYGFKSFHKPKENKLKGKTFYHGSPNKNITKFDEKYAGSNVGTDFSGIFFTDNKDFAEDFSYERKEKGLVFDKKGEKGKVYEAELDMKNPLDLNNLTEKELQDIKENYLLDLGFGKEKSWKWFNEYLEAGNIQGAKMYIDFKKMINDGKYDGYIADVGGKYKGSNEYVIFKGNQANLKNPRNYDAEIQALEEKSKGLSMFSPERRKITEQIQQLEAEKNGFKTYDELKEFRHNKVVEQSNKISGNVNTPEKNIKNEHKEKQLEIINKFNPMQDDYHTGIRSVKDIKSPQEAFDVNNDENYTYPDFTVEDGKKALQTGKIMVYSSKPISQGGFISPSKMMAQDYAGRSGKVYSQLVDINDVAWINSDEGQYAKV